jgi:hypothetical protein
VIDQAHRLIVQIFVKIALLLQVGFYVRIPPDGPVMLPEENFSFASPHLDRFVDIAGPGGCIADLGAAEGQEVVKIVRGVLCHVKGFELR